MQPDISRPPSPPASAWAEWRPVLAIIAAAALLWGLLWSHSYLVALQNPDAQDYAQIARHLARGEGFRTSVLPLNGLEWMRETGRLGSANGPWPNVHRFPMMPVVEAGFFRALGANDFSAALSSAVFFFATIPLVFLFARRLFPRRVGVLAAFLYAFSGGPISDSITGLTEPAAVFLFMAALYLVLWPRAWWAIPLAGALTGLGFLNRSSAVLYGLPMLILVWRARPGRGAAALATFIAPGALVAFPWLVRNFRLTGDPLFSLTTALMAPYMSSVSPSTHAWYLFQYQTAGRFLAEHPGAALGKWFVQVGGLFWAGVRKVGDVEWIVPLFALSILKRYDRRTEEVRRWLLFLFGLHLLILPLLSNIPRYYVLFTPFIVLFAAEVIVGFMDALLPRPRAGQWVLFVVLGALPMFSWAFIVGPPRKPREYRVRFETRFENTDWLRDNTPPDALIVSDIPWSVGWYADRRSLPIPPTPGEMLRFSDYGLRPDGIYLKAPQRTIDTPNGWDQWRVAQYARRAPAGYRLAHVFPDDAVYFALAVP